MRESTLCVVVHERSSRGGMICVEESFTHDFEDGFWIADNKMSRMWIFSSSPFLSAGLLVDDGCRLGRTVGMKSMGTKWGVVHIVPPPPSSALPPLVVSSRESFIPASSSDTRLGDVVIDVLGVEIAELIAAAVAAAAPIAPPG